MKHKPNAIFAEATTGVAFVLTLSKRQCNTLLRLQASEKLHGKPKPCGGETHRGDKTDPAYISIVQVDSLRGLKDRGLVFWYYRNNQPCGFGGLTRAGEICADLLIEAGLSIKNTNTLSVLKRLDRVAA